MTDYYDLDLLTELTVLDLEPSRPNQTMCTKLMGVVHIEVDNVAFRVGRHGGGLVAIGDIGDDGGGHKVAEEIANMVIYMEDTGGTDIGQFW